MTNLPKNELLRDNMVRIAARAALAGGQIVAQVHGASPETLQTVWKAADGDTPKTVADERAEWCMLQIIRGQFPTHSIYAEETGIIEGSDWWWFIDPLDGTLTFARNQKYSTVGLMVCQGNPPTPVVASVCHPFERELYLAKRGMGAYCYQLTAGLNMLPVAPIKMEVSAQTLAKGVFYVDALFNLKTARRKTGLILELTKKVGQVNVRETGSNIDQQRMVALGRAEASLTDCMGGFHDLAGWLLVEEAGGKVTNLRGMPPTLEDQVVLASNGIVHETLLPLMQRHYTGYKGFR